MVQRPRRTTESQDMEAGWRRPDTERQARASPAVDAGRGGHGSGGLAWGWRDGAGVEPQCHHATRASRRSCLGSGSHHRHAAFVSQCRGAADAAGRGTMALGHPEPNCIGIVELHWHPLLKARRRPVRSLGSRTVEQHVGSCERRARGEAPRASCTELLAEEGLSRVRHPFFWILLSRN